MKKVLLGSLICILLLSLFACGKKKEIPAVDTEAVIYGEGTIPAVVVSAGIPETAETEITSLCETIAARVGSAPRKGSDSEIEKTGVEIVIGDSSRAITARAKEYLPAYAGDDVAGFAVLFDADGVAIVWNHEAGAVGGIRYFIDAYLSGATLKVYPGTYYVGGVSVYDYEQEREAARLEAIETAWAARFDVVEDPDVREAVRSFYEGIYDPEKLIRWWAGLYDPDRGGFYYSNSARDHEGFLPDMESTYQVLNRVRDFVPDLKEFLGEDLTQKIVTFYREKQDQSDGYFYHPQWTKEESRKNVMRYSRDQDWAIFVLGWLGSEPPYPTALDRAAQSSESGGSTATEWQPNVASVTAYVNNQLNTRTCEQWANTLETQATTFQATGMLDAVLDVLDARINPEYGVWVSGYDAATDLYFNLKNARETETPYGIFTNAYKVAKMYNIAGRHIPYTDKTVANAIKAICSRDPGIRVTYLFNPWATLGNVRQNLVAYGTPAEVAAYDAQIKEHVVEMVDALQTSLALYRCEDGSYGYLKSGSNPSVYSTTVSLGVKEGDVNGNNLVVLCAAHICTAIGLDDMIPIFNELHGELLIDILNNAPSIRKNGSFSGNLYNFTDDASGTLPEGAKVITENGTTFKVTADPANADNNVLEIKKNTEGNDAGGSLTLPLIEVPTMYDNTVVEFKMKIKVDKETRYGNEITGTNPNLMQMRFMSGNTPFWMPTLRFTTNGNPTEGYYLVVGKNTASALFESPDRRTKVFQYDTWYELTFRMKIKSYGTTDAKFSVEILVDGDLFGTSICFYSNDASALDAGDIAFEAGKTVNLRFAPQMRTHALIYVDDITASYTRTAD
ncbi:MAG: hypothetical protein J5958_03225 [Clostridia bacterium]|nr:hypothetical protein [Clostridia bacterium]